MRATLTRLMRAEASTLAWILLYLALQAAFVARTATGGLLMPETAPDPALLALGAAVVVLRVGLLVVVPARWAARATRWALLTAGATRPDRTDPDPRRTLQGEAPPG